MKGVRGERGTLVIASLASMSARAVGSVMLFFIWVPT